MAWIACHRRRFRSSPGGKVIAPALCLLAALTTAEAEMIRDKNNTGATVWVFRDIEAFERFRKMEQARAYDEGLVSPLLACKPPQGSKVKVFSSGDLTAFVRVEEGSAKGCEGTVPLEFVQQH